MDLKVLLGKLSSLSSTLGLSEWATEDAQADMLRLLRKARQEHGQLKPIDLPLIKREILRKYSNLNPVDLLDMADEAFKNVSKEKSESIVAGNMGVYVRPLGYSRGKRPGVDKPPQGKDLTAWLKRRGKYPDTAGKDVDAAIDRYLHGKPSVKESQHLSKDVLLDTFPEVMPDEADRLLGIVRENGGFMDRDTAASFMVRAKEYLTGLGVVEKSGQIYVDMGGAYETTLVWNDADQEVVVGRPNEPPIKEDSWADMKDAHENSIWQVVVDSGKGRLFREIDGNDMVLTYRLWAPEELPEIPPVQTARIIGGAKLTKKQITLRFDRTAFTDEGILRLLDEPLVGESMCQGMSEKLDRLLGLLGESDKRDAEKSAQHYADMKRYTKHAFVPSSDDWHPTLKDGTVEVKLLPLSTGEWRVSVWGGDDTGMEKDFSDKDEAYRTYHRVAGMAMVNMHDLRALGFDWA